MLWIRILLILLLPWFLFSGFVHSKYSLVKVRNPFKNIALVVYLTSSLSDSIIRVNMRFECKLFLPFLCLNFILRPISSSIRLSLLVKLKKLRIINPLCSCTLRVTCGLTLILISLINWTAFLTRIVSFSRRHISVNPHCLILFNFSL